MARQILDPSVPVNRLNTLNELKWLRGCALTVHAMIQVVEQLDADARASVDWSAVAYLTEQMENACGDGGALHQAIENLERRSRATSDTVPVSTPRHSAGGR